MKRGLFVLAGLTLSSALYAQQTLTLEQARHIVADFNPQLLERAAQNADVNSLVEEMISSYVEAQPTDTLETRYALAALARNFDNSIALHAAVQQYKDALRYTQAGGNVHAAAEQTVTTQLSHVYPRIWAVSIQTKEALLKAYEQEQRSLRKDKTLSADVKEEQLRALDFSDTALRADIKQLRTRTGEQLRALTQATLAQAKAQVAQERAALQEQTAAQTTNLQVKSNHKKPVAK